MNLVHIELVTNTVFNFAGLNYKMHAFVVDSV